MHFEEGDLYHIYNQGNDRVPIFFSHENYSYFLDKIRLHILPHADILAWCLMPNHFHIMAYVHSLEIEIQETGMDSSLILPAGYTSEDVSTDSNSKKRDLNNSIGVMLRSYTRAIDEQEKKSGSLFRKKTKAICLEHSETLTIHHDDKRKIVDSEGFTVSIDRDKRKFIDNEGFTLITEYPQVCFNYIHNNPVKAGLVRHPEEWEFSSFRDHCGMRNGKLINRKRTEEFGLVIAW